MIGAKFGFFANFQLPPDHSTRTKYWSALSLSFSLIRSLMISSSLCYSLSLNHLTTIYSSPLCIVYTALNSLYYSFFPILYISIWFISLHVLLVDGSISCLSVLPGLFLLPKIFSPSWIDCLSLFDTIERESVADVEICETVVNRHYPWKSFFYWSLEVRSKKLACNSDLNLVDVIVDEALV